MGRRTEVLGLEARRAANNARWRRFLSNGVANQPDASVLGPEFRDETDIEREIKDLEVERDELAADLAQMTVERDQAGLTDALTREIEQLEANIAHERQMKKE